MTGAGPPIPPSVGVDLVDVARIARLVERGDAIESVLTAAEAAYCRARRRVAEHVAARFAAKEAVLKALGTGRAEGIGWHDVEVLKDARGRPVVQLRGAAAAYARRHGLASMAISLTHTGEYAAAHAMATWNHGA